jgi:type IX secretion system PorP/SprF family membrane protein
MKNTLLKLTLVIIGFAGFTSLYSQQEVQNSLYMFNPSILNPAYAGSRDALSGVVDYRQQWVKWDGAPTTAMLCLHSPLKMEAVALGLNLVHDKIGATKNTAIYGDIAYRIRLNSKKDRLSFGVRVGGDYYSANFTTLKATDINDQIQANGYTKFLFNVGAGVYYYGKKHYVGFAVPKLIQNEKLNVSNFQSKQNTHFYFVAGYVFKLNSMVAFKPSIQLKYTKNAPLSAEANASFLFMDKFWIGGMYRHQAAIGANIMYQINEVLRVGYAYDYTTTAMTKYSPSSHEIMVGFDLRGNRNSFKTPRYF